MAAFPLTWMDFESTVQMVVLAATTDQPGMLLFGKCNKYTDLSSKEIHQVRKSLPNYAVHGRIDLKRKTAGTNYMGTMKVLALHTMLISAVL